MFARLCLHEGRLAWRSLISLINARTDLRAALILTAFVAVAHALAFPAARWFTPSLAGPEFSPRLVMALAGAVFFWMSAQSLFAATRMLFDRGDLVLLLSSPVPSRVILAEKAAAIMASTLGSVAILVVPIANMGVLFFGSAWLAVYPVLFALALIATALGLSIAMALFNAFGPRRARLYANLSGAALGGVFVLGAQVLAILPSETRIALQSWLQRSAGGEQGLASRIVRLPLDAVSGDLMAIAAMLVLALALSAAAARLMGQSFAEAVISAAGAPGETVDSSAFEPLAPFNGGVANNLRLKEWRLLLRDPGLFAQLALQIIYTLPIAVILVRSQVMPTAVAMVPVIVMIAAQVAGSIAWLTVSGEDAPELIASAPVSKSAVERAKLSAVALPVLVLLALPLLALSLISLRCAGLALAFSAMAGTTTALVNFWHPMPGNRRGMLRRHSQSKLVGFIEHALAGLWTVAAVLSMLSLVAPLVPVAMVLLTLWAVRSRAMKDQRAPAMPVSISTPRSPAHSSEWAPSAGT